MGVAYGYIRSSRFAIKPLRRSSRFAFLNHSDRQTGADRRSSTWTSALVPRAALFLVFPFDLLNTNTEQEQEHTRKKDKNRNRQEKRRRFCFSLFVFVWCLSPLCLLAWWCLICLGLLGVLLGDFPNSSCTCFQSRSEEKRVSMVESTFTQIDYRVEGPLAVISLNRPDGSLSSFRPIPSFQPTPS